VQINQGKGGLKDKKVLFLTQYFVVTKMVYGQSRIRASGIVECTR